VSQTPRLPADLAALMAQMAHRPYRELVEARLKSLTGNQLTQALAQAAQEVAAEFRPGLEAYRQALAGRFLVSRLFWQASTCREALANLLEAAEEAMPHQRLSECHRAPLAEQNRELASSLFEWATLSFPEAAARDGKQRKLMGLKRGWLR